MKNLYNVVMKRDKIPVLKGDLYRQSYFKNMAAQEASFASRSDAQHFEIHERCLFRDVILPHRLDYYLVFVVAEGEGLQMFGSEEHYIKPNMLCFVSPNVISSWKAGDHVDEHKGYLCTFSDDFFNVGRDNKNYLAELPFFQIGGASVLHLSDKQMQDFLILFRQMHDEFSNGHKYSDDIFRAQLQILLAKANAIYSFEDNKECAPNKPGLRLLRAFTTLYMRESKNLNEGKVVQYKKISAYASELGVSQNHLNDTVKEITGKSAGQLIKNHAIKLATMCLKHSTKTIGEIAYQFGYDDPSYFSRYYKNQTGQSPSELR